MLNVEVPDFEEMARITDTIRDLDIKEKKLSLLIKTKESEVVMTVMTNPMYYQGGKSPSMAFIESTYKHSGLTGELVKIREEYAEVVSNLNYAKMLLEMNRLKISMYQTESANQRAAIE